VRIAGLKYVKEAGLTSRVAYKSMTPDASEAEIEATKESGIKSSIVLALNSKNPTISGRLQTVDGLLNLAERAGIENALVDTVNLDIPDPGPASKTVYHVKDQYGLPTGAGTHNAINI
jgi:tetrahydromethanopterin S-methyltransferase subunit H